jgi:hypothetical protein
MDAYIDEDSEYPYTSVASTCEYTEIDPFTWDDSGTEMALKVGSRTFANTVTYNRPTPD